MISSAASIRAPSAILAGRAALLDRRLAPDTVRRGLEAFIEHTGTDEIMVAGQIFDHAARLRSFEIAAQAHQALGRAA